MLLAEVPFEQAAEYLSVKYPVVVGIEWSGSNGDWP